MKNRTALPAIAITLAAGAAMAQAPLGTVTQVQGIATVTTGTSGAAIAAGAPVVNGARVITTSSGTVTLRLNNGCTVTVPPGHALTVVSGLSCQQLTAAITPTATTTTTATARVPATTTMGATGAEVAVVNGVIVGTGALIAAAIAADVADEDDEPVSAR